MSYKKMYIYIFFKYVCKKYYAIKIKLQVKSVPDFDDWEKVENYRNIVEFNERMGPKRVLDGSRNAADYFQLFTHIANFTNRNPTKSLTCLSRSARSFLGMFTRLKCPRSSKFSSPESSDSFAIFSKKNPLSQIACNLIVLALKTTKIFLK
jgi:hypothetical protein